MDSNLTSSISSSGNSINIIWLGAGDGGISTIGLLQPKPPPPPPIRITGGIDKTGRWYTSGDSLFDRCCGCVGAGVSGPGVKNGCSDDRLRLYCCCCCCCRSIWQRKSNSPSAFCNCVSDKNQKKKNKSFAVHGRGYLKC